MDPGGDRLVSWLYGDDEKDRRKRRRQQAEEQAESEEEPEAQGVPEPMTTVYYRKIRCPRCGAKKGIRNNGRYPGLPLTYHQCQECGQKFRAREVE